MPAPVAAIVGAGQIAPFHIRALRASGFNVSHIAAQVGSSRARDLGAEFEIQHVWENAADLVMSDTWDALVLASSTESLTGLLRLAAKKQRPCLVEKPISFSPARISEFLGDDHNVRVGYNRRFYPAVAAARTFAEAGPCIFRLELPERIDSSNREMRGLRSVHENSVHGLDLLAYVLGRYRIETISNVLEPRGKLAFVVTEAGHVGSIVLNWNCPANFALVLDRAPKRFELKPFEIGTTFEGIDVIQPSIEVPIRRFVPRLIHQADSFSSIDGMKPGFFEQAQSLMSAVQRGEWDSRSATISDAVFVAEVAHILTNDDINPGVPVNDQPAG